MGKRYVDENGYERGEVPHSNLLHRQIAYDYIYKLNRELYPLKFSDYVVHHIDGNKRNNDPANLKLMEKEDHEAHHGIKGIVKNPLEDLNVGEHLHESDVDLVSEEKDEEGVDFSTKDKSKKINPKDKWDFFFFILICIIVLIGITENTVPFSLLFVAVVILVWVLVKRKSNV